MEKLTGKCQESDRERERAWKPKQKIQTGRTRLEERTKLKWKSYKVETNCEKWPS